MADHRPELSWTDRGVPVSAQFDDPYYSLEDGLAETRHVFLNGNDLPARFAPGFHIAELGFGTGLNLLATLHAWRSAGVAGPLTYTAFEAWPLSGETMIRAQSTFPDLAEIAADLAPYWREGARRIDRADLRFRLVVGDARQTLTSWAGAANAWYLDGFSPAKNPELWERELLQQVAYHTEPDGTVASYTAAGFVRRALTDAGFEVRRDAGFGRKRHMTCARKPE